ncbi:hypothetical protein GXM_02054 [Nostoc sphaeroides CCNUC1]|uniref:Uncharacterized protein n=2 Tax=Nostoc sphaeroides TaxID=446679 RepID=A0A5P8VXF3_9NOSO|nr:hypothetical protein GXM_02054 [Nostoc sphaeroides CCNUC1]
MPNSGMSTTGYSASPYRKPQKLSDRCCGRVSDRLSENLKNNAIAVVEG